MGPWLRRGTGCDSWNSSSPSSLAGRPRMGSSQSVASREPARRAAQGLWDRPRPRPRTRDTWRGCAINSASAWWRRRSAHFGPDSPGATRSRRRASRPRSAPPSKTSAILEADLEGGGEALELDPLLATPAPREVQGADARRQPDSGGDSGGSGPGPRVTPRTSPRRGCAAGDLRCGLPRGGPWGTVCRCSTRTVSAGVAPGGLAPDRAPWLWARL